ncbi:MAG: YHS domain-containing (seleno)protein [Litorimonas sp.]
MQITRKFLTVFVPATLMLVAPIAAAQVSPLETAETSQALEAATTVQIGDEQTEQQQRPASWRGQKLALRGRDVVSFYKDSGPVKGSKEFIVDWDDTKWRFSSEENRDAFKANPEKYIPEFGGYCPVALAAGKAKIGRTNQYTKIDDKLYLNYNEANRRKFAGDPEDYALRAQISW